MSEEPRLSRRQLREMGELTVRDASTPSLTETEELRLRRPSRRELREAERVNEAVEERIRQSVVPTHELAEHAGTAAQPETAAVPKNAEGATGAVHGEYAKAGDTPQNASEASSSAAGADAAEDTSFGAFFEDFGSAEADEKAAVAETNATAAGAPESGLAAAAAAAGSEPTHPAVVLERKSVFERFTDDEAAADSEPPVEADNEADTSHSLQERLIQRTGEDRIGEQFTQGLATGAIDAGDNTDTPAAEAETAEETAESNSPEELQTASAAEAPSADQPAVEAEQSGKLEASDELEASGVADEPDATETAATAEQSAPTVADTAADHDAEASGEAAHAAQLPEAPADPAETTEIDSASVAAEIAHEADVNAPAEPEKAGTPTADESVVTVDTNEGSPVFGWLVLLLLIAIGALIGYLGGTWIKATWLSAPDIAHAAVAGAGIFL